MRKALLLLGWFIFHSFLYGNFDVLEEASVSHINTTIGGKKFEDAAIFTLRQGALNAAVQTVGACIANKIGDMADSKMATEQIGDITQEIFHGFLGAGIGAGTAAIMGQDVGKGASSGAIGAVVGHSTAKISGSKALGDLVAVTIAMMTDQDVGIAYMASNNATTYNYAAHRDQNTEAKGDEKEDEEVKQSFLAGLQEGDANKPTAEQQAYERGRQRYLKESLEQARRHRGRELSDRSRERVIDSASKLFGRYHSSCEALGIMTNPANVLRAGSYIPGIPGAIAGVGEASYGVYKGTHDFMDVTQAGITGAMGILKGAKGLVQGASAAKRYKKVSNTTSELESLYTAQSKTGSSFLRFDTKASAITKKAAEYEDLLGASRFQSVSGNISNTPITWTAPTGTGQTYKIWQRSDIDWNMVRNSKVGDRRFMGKTNAEAARAGVAPELKDGSFATLHHIGQNNNGPLVEATTRLHNFRNPKAFRSLHNQFGKGVKHPTNPVDHNIFAKETSEYWKVRILNEF